MYSLAGALRVWSNGSDWAKRSRVGRAHRNQVVEHSDRLQRVRTHPLAELLAAVLGGHVVELGDELVECVARHPVPAAAPRGRRRAARLRAVATVVRHLLVRAAPAAAAARLFVLALRALGTRQAEKEQNQ